MGRKICSDMSNVPNNISNENSVTFSNVSSRRDPIVVAAQFLLNGILDVDQSRY